MRAGALGACVARVRSALPPELAGAFSALGYVPHEDACRLDLAVRLRDPALCDAVALSALRTSCRARAAMAVENASGCPPALLDRGRDPVCVAVASRSLALCAAGAPADRARCTAIARARPALCDALPEALRASCASDVEALAPAVGRALEGSMPTLAASEFTLEPPVSSGTSAGVDAGATVRVEEPAGYARGGWIATEPDGALSLVLTDPARGWPSVTGGALAPREHPVVAVRVSLPARGERSVLLALRVITAPDGAVYEWVPGAHATPVRMDRVPHQRGDVVSISLETQVARGGDVRRLTLAARVFVRDLVPLEELTHGDAPELEAPTGP